MPTSITALLTLFALTAPASIALAAQAGAAQQAVPVQSLVRGTMSQMTRPAHVVVRDEFGWKALWRAHAGEDPSPPVDFSTRMVVAVFMGTKPTGGYSIEVTSARRETGTIVVSYTEKTPAAGAMLAQVLTAPFHIVTLPLDATPVRFESAR